MPRDWKLYWQDTARNESDLLLQVGRKVGGKPTSRSEIDVLVNQIQTHMAGGTYLLDLCCGNGFLTSRLRPNRRVVGLDYSEALIEVAKRNFSDIEFLAGSVFDLDIVLGSRHGFDRVIMLESLQYFSPADVKHWLPKLLHLCSEDARLLLQGVPDCALYDKFANTPDRREDMARRRKTEGDPIGYWWGREVLEDLARAQGLRATFCAADPTLNTSHYRFDVILERM